MRLLSLILIALAAPAAAQRGPYIPREVAVPGMGAGEAAAHRLWNLRAALNVAALQCQFSPILRTVPSYNAMIKQHARELERARATLAAFFAKGEPKKGPARAFDQYTTRTYQSYSTLDAQLPFCDAAASAARDALAQPIGRLTELAPERVAAVRLSLTPVGDPLGRMVAIAAPPVVIAAAPCDERDRRRGRC